MDNIYYVYAYLDTRKPGNFTYDYLTFEYEPFYIGKGCYDRDHSHLYEAYDETIISYKHNKIRKIIAETGNNPIILRIFENLSEEKAYLLEEKIIWQIGFWRANKFPGEHIGPLTNMMNGGRAPPRPIAGEFHTSRSSANGTHHWMGPEVMKAYHKRRIAAGIPSNMQIRSDNGTHWWTGDLNPIHKRIESGSVIGINHHYNNRDCQYNCDKEFLDLPGPYRVELTHNFALELGFKKRQNLYLSVHNRIKLKKILGSYVEENYYSPHKRTYFCVKTGTDEEFYLTNNAWITIDHTKDDDIRQSPRVLGEIEIKSSM